MGATEDEMVGWHHWCNHELEQTSGDNHRQGGLCVLQSIGSQSIRHDWATELKWTELGYNCATVKNRWCIKSWFRREERYLFPKFLKWVSFAEMKTSSLTFHLRCWYSLGNRYAYYYACLTEEFNKSRAFEYVSILMGWDLVLECVQIDFT